MPEASGADEAVLVESGRKLGLAYVLYGSITKLGSSISIYLNLFSVKVKWTELFYAKGDSLESIEGLTERLAKDIITYTGGSPVPKTYRRFHNKGKTRHCLNSGRALTSKAGIDRGRRPRQRRGKRNFSLRKTA